MNKKAIDSVTIREMDSNTVEAVTIDCTIFGLNEGVLEVLLVQHAEGISKGKWGLPGGWIRKDESIDAAAYRLLRDLTGLENIYLEQLRAFGDPARFPLSRVITIGYYALIKKQDYRLKPGFTASAVKWYKVKQVPELIYDHTRILEVSLKRLKRRVRQAPVGFNLLPEKFTLLQLMHLYEEILEVEMDKPNFRRKFLKMKLLVPLNEKETDVSHRAAQLYRFDPKIYEQLTEKGFNFEF
ncbi:NUDIX hydrolase [Sinomicrobium soli]|uniref:NUDIX hydrolase n=1 Tax=Sinomicrobium sp. N-1-3-6 TaxID=2219864 RepID=UPI000DCD7106|nr:NUDIX domain-containing protein [Sinomicrobium sp. N-1-3-6]RAV28711.1 NUDIX hydrolase [Sinomicrobium sp. N-1-3-6]